MNKTLAIAVVASGFLGQAGFAEERTTASLHREAEAPGFSTTHSSSAERDYHYGATPEALLALRLLFGSVANFDVTAREYYVSGVASTENRGSELVFRGDAALTVRIYGHHTLTLKYVASHRDSSYPDLADRHQTIGTFSLLYGLISDVDFGAVGAAY